MLRLSSITTATMFCCGRSVAILSAGCHNRNSSKQTNIDSSSQTIPVRKPRIEGAIALRRFQMTKPNPAAATIRASISAQGGHWPSSTKVPLLKTVGGYLNRNSNIGTECRAP
jgi:hypothetical protein